jgi:HD superfamily phosphodiesterase
MKQADAILSAEIRLKPLLEEFFRKTWGKSSLYSHDIDHHRRVWEYSKELYSISGSDEFSAENLLVASYLHDIGMATDPGIRHGYLSRELCRSFLSENKLDERLFSEALEAIEFHDDKDYNNQSAEISQVLKILSASDDLDAFGYTGIYRYLEIYLTRGIGREEIGYRIRENASKRFRYFLSHFSRFPDLIERHRKRHKILDDFMAEYNMSIKTGEPFHDPDPWQPIVVDIVTGMIAGKISPYDIKSLCDRYPDNRHINNFSDNLVSELNAISWNQK